MRARLLLGASVITGALACGSAAGQAPISKTDLFVTYTASLGGHAGQTLPISVRRRVAIAPVRGAPDGDSRVVLFIHGAPTPGTFGFDLDATPGYSWMEVMAREGFDVWAMDLTGHGRSARPTMDDPCNVDPELQKTVLAGSTLKAPCGPTNPYQFNTISGEWEEIGAVVEHIRKETGIRKVNLIGWSAGGPRAGGYAVKNLDKVNRVVLYAPRIGNVKAIIADKVAAGFPTTLRLRDSFFKDWTGAAKCEGQIDPSLLDVFWPAVIKTDPVGAGWGHREGGGVLRHPVRTDGDWTPDMIGQLKMPVLVIVGEFDNPEARRTLYQQLGSADKVFVKVACATHFMLWEKQRNVLYDTSIEWMKFGTVKKTARGEFSVDEAGRFAAFR